MTTPLSSAFERAVEKDAERLAKRCSPDFQRLVATILLLQVCTLGFFFYLFNFLRKYF